MTFKKDVREDTPHKMAQHDQRLSSIDRKVLRFRGIELEMPSIRRGSTSTHGWQFCQLERVLGGMTADLVEKPS